MEKKDGEIDYSACSLSELKDVEAHIDAEANPKNHANLQLALSRRDKPEVPIAETVEEQASSEHFGGWLLVLGGVTAIIRIWWNYEEFGLFNIGVHSTAAIGAASLAAGFGLVQKTQLAEPIAIAVLAMQIPFLSLPMVTWTITSFAGLTLFYDFGSGFNLENEYLYLSVALFSEVEGNPRIVGINLFPLAILIGYFRSVNSEKG